MTSKSTKIDVQHTNTKIPAYSKRSPRGNTKTRKKNAAEIEAEAQVAIATDHQRHPVEIETIKTEREAEKEVAVETVARLLGVAIPPAVVIVIVVAVVAIVDHAHLCQDLAVAAAIEGNNIKP